MAHYKCQKQRRLHFFRCRRLSHADTGSLDSVLSWLPQRPSPGRHYAQLNSLRPRDLSKTVPSTESRNNKYGIMRSLCFASLRISPFKPIQPLQDVIKAGHHLTKLLCNCRQKIILSAFHAAFLFWPGCKWFWFHSLQILRAWHDFGNALVMKQLSTTAQAPMACPTDLVGVTRAATDFALVELFHGSPKVSRKNCFLLVLCLGCNLGWGLVRHCVQLLSRGGARSWRRLGFRRGLFHRWRLRTTGIRNP